ncbi:basic membrane lipoprotein [Ketogulonicigenium robustum]|uniref:Basic membrane lipoprotein n=1 Tax=Ketogulonicigenium robustum TaxID=92947 RepID=A0A1W6NYK2_9RHOB|nr:BMP family ABC transporter substrate-binding protein [Ketogulonicigenium robustum]ARO14180.1 basic membrane lipoprotein [Ketogulonicigenium robustum]
MSTLITRRGLGQLLLATTAVAGFVGAASAQAKTRVAFVVHGQLGDKSFLDSAAAGLNRAAESMPIEATVIEPGNDRARWEPALADACDQGYDIIVVGTWEMTGFVVALAPEFPDTKFIIFDDAPDFAANNLPNVIAITYRTSTAAFLAGYAAAKVSQTGKIGEIFGVEGATILEFAVGFEQGARLANPDVELIRAVAGSFTDPAKGKELALTQFAQGADIVFPIAGGTGIGALQAARDEGKLAVGVDSDQALIFEATDEAQAKAIFTSVEKKVGDSIYLVLEQTLAGTAPYGSIVVLGLQEGAVGISKNAYYEASVPAEVRAEVDALEAQIIAGEITVETMM